MNKLPSGECIFSLNTPEGRRRSELVKRAFSGLQLDQTTVVDLGIFPFSNDALTEETVKDVAEQNYQQNGMAAFVGTGGAYSYLPRVMPDIPLIIDKDITTQKLHAMLGEVILKSCSVRDIKTGINDIKPHSIPYFLPEDYLAKMDVEVALFGRYHWLRNLEATKHQIANHPPVYITADLNDPSLPKGLLGLNQLTGARFKFANFTNVAHWQVHSNMPIDFAKAYPEAPTNLVVYSDYLPPDKPSTRLHTKTALGFAAYVQACTRPLAA